MQNKGLHPRACGRPRLIYVFNYTDLLRKAYRLDASMNKRIAIGCFECAFPILKVYFLKNWNKRPLECT